MSCLSCPSAHPHSHSLGVPNCLCSCISPGICPGCRGLYDVLVYRKLTSMQQSQSQHLLSPATLPQVNNLRSHPFCSQLTCRQLKAGWPHLRRSHYCSSSVSCPPSPALKTRQPTAQRMPSSFWSLGKPSRTALSSWRTGERTAPTHANGAELRVTLKAG